MNAAKRLLKPGNLVAAALVVALVLAAFVLWPSADRVTVTGKFTRAVGLFPGSDVRILGVKVGEVDSVTPRGDVVEVRFSYDAKYKVPADAQAAVVAPSLVSDRYVQLLPVWTKGPALQDGAVIGTERTAVPVELDRISESLDDLMVALGPKGANKNGALSRFVDTSAANLQGQGKQLHDTIEGLSRAVQTLDEGKGDLFGTVRNLQSFTTMLAQNDAQVRRLNTDLASVSEQLDGERGDLQAALKNLAVALDDISTFVKDNRSLIKSDVARLTSVTNAVIAKRQALTETLTNAPTALSNLQLAYNPSTGTLDTRSNIRQLDDPGLLLCSLLSGPRGQADSKLCQQLIGKIRVPGLPFPLGTSANAATPGAYAAAPGAADPTLGGLLPGGK